MLKNFKLVEDIVDYVVDFIVNCVQINNRYYYK